MSHRSTLPRLAATLLAAIALAPGLALVAPPAAAETEEELLARREHWQAKYRQMLHNRAILTRNIERLEHNYAQAQRRNYPRGGARQAFLDQANEQRELLAEIEQDIESIFREARAADVPPGWLYEVEDDVARNPMPAAKEPAADVADREGRNPLYAEDDEEDDR